MALFASRTGGAFDNGQIDFAGLAALFIPASLSLHPQLRTRWRRHRLLPDQAPSLASSAFSADQRDTLPPRVL